jgi:hypothetical protein
VNCTLIRKSPDISSWKAITDISISSNNLWVLLPAASQMPYYAVCNPFWGFRFCFNFVQDLWRDTMANFVLFSDAPNWSGIVITSVMAAYITSWEIPLSVRCTRVLDILKNRWFHYSRFSQIYAKSINTPTYMMLQLMGSIVTCCKRPHYHRYNCPRDAITDKMFHLLKAQNKSNLNL